jgi:hypothetical protein
MAPSQVHHAAEKIGQRMPIEDILARVQFPAVKQSSQVKSWGFGVSAEEPVSSDVSGTDARIRNAGSPIVRSDHVAQEQRKGSEVAGKDIVDPDRHPFHVRNDWLHPSPSPRRAI